MDIFIGAQSVLIDNDLRRRSLYGKSGEYRLQPWGCEYRVLSSSMLKDIDNNVDWIWESMEKVMTIFEKVKPSLLDKLFRLVRKDVELIINENDTSRLEMVNKIVYKLTGVLPSQPIRVKEVQEAV